ncbi:hybrid sensor histidine kinase/response regulator [Nitratireductor basaltis]|nr:PAS domain-containing hybrid sensor histidine kinase/response regulator [Nitratireductor basaltis]
MTRAGVIQRLERAWAQASKAAGTPLAKPLIYSDQRHSSFASKALVFIAFSNLALAGLAYLTGTSPAIYVGLLLVTFMAIAFSFSKSRGEGVVAEEQRAMHQNALQMEELADRMWEMRESEQRFYGLLEGLGDLVVHRDRDGRILYANKVLGELLGMEVDQAYGKTLSHLGIEIPIVPEAAFADGESISSTDVAVRTGRGLRWFAWTELSMRDTESGEASHWAIARDITARKLAETALVNARERAEQASHAKSRFLATVSHEIRTPMNGIMGMATLLADTTLTHEQRTYVGAISTSSGALLALIEDLLDYSKIEAGKLELEAQKMDVREMVESIVELMATRAFAKSIGLGCHISPLVPEYVNADPGRLRQVLLNLLGNAIKFTETGGVLLTVIPSQKDGKPALSFRVEDTGPGIEQNALERIFKDFEQAESGSTRRHGGAGLGLAITRRLVEAMKGRIIAESAPGEGATFTVTLPLDGEADEEAKNTARSLAGYHVGILASHEMEAEALSRSVRAHGGRSTIIDPTAASKSAQGEDLDALIVDASLEKEDGSCLRKLRENGWKAKRNITLIAPSERGRLASFRANGYGAFLARPARTRTMLRMLLSEIPNRPSEVPSPKAGRKAARGAHTGLHVLVAEDNEINALLARSALTRAGHRVEVVTNGRAALDVLTKQSRPYDIVLMDLHMPVLDGLDAIAGVRRFEEEAGMAPIPILVLSADGQEKTRQGVLAHGASGFVTKPLDPDKLLLTLETHMAA